MRKTCKHLSFIKNVSFAITNQKNPSFRLSLWDFKKKIPNTFIYASILIYMNANIMNTQIFHSVKYDSTVIEGHKTLTYVLMDNFLVLVLFYFCKTNINIFFNLFLYQINRHTYNYDTKSY